MNRDDIIRMAREAGVLKMVGGHLGWQEFTERFAALVAAAEREACADWIQRIPYYDWVDMSQDECVAGLREARSEE